MKRDLDRYINTLLGCELFAGFTREDVAELMALARAKVVEYKKDEPIYHCGDQVQSMGLVLEGTVVVEADDAEGDKTNLNILTSGDEFGAFLVVSGARHSPMNVYAAARAKVMFLDIERLAMSPNRGRVTWLLVDSLLHAFSGKLVDQYKRMRIVGQKRVRTRVRMYLMTADREGDVVTLPVTRTEWASYLGVDRTALAREISRMQADGIIEADKRRIRLLDKKFFGIHSEGGL